MEYFEKKYDGEDKDKLPEHAEHYLNRLRSFQDSLLGWVVTWNIAFVGGLFYLIEKQSIEFYNTIISFFPFVTFILNVCFIFLYFKSSYTSNEIVNRYLPDFKTEDCIIKKAPKNRVLFTLIIVFIQIVISGIISLT